MTGPAWSIHNAGSDALMLRFADQPDPAGVSLIRAASDRLASLKETGEVQDLVPAYTTLMVCYNPLLNDFDSLAGKIAAQLQGLDSAPQDNGRLVTIPVWYDPEVGPDLERVAQWHGISIDEVIRRHCDRDYPVVAIGFAPGFAYLGDVAPNLATPRLDSPRARVAPGTVALAERQTAVYPIATPGGWNLLGRTAMRLFDPTLEGLCPVAPGDRVRFVPITRAQFLASGGTL